MKMSSRNSANEGKYRYLQYNAKNRRTIGCNKIKIGKFTFLTLLNEQIQFEKHYSLLR